MNCPHHRVSIAPASKIFLREALPMRPCDRPPLLSQIGKGSFFICPASGRIFQISIQQKPSSSKKVQPGKLVHQALSHCKKLLYPINLKTKKRSRARNHVECLPASPDQALDHSTGSYEPKRCVFWFILRRSKFGKA